MKKTVKHKWYEKLHASVDWCQFCGALRYHQHTGFWGKVEFKYVVPWNHPGGNQNKDVLNSEPVCVTVDVPDETNPIPEASAPSP